ncbi:MAG: endo-1,4-beta-xylanase [Bacteroidia bacterium]|nr:endo-1,4-beta-xylanase [Bacteroidia bacterium]
MKQLITLLSIWCLCVLSVSAQDAYHSNLKSNLQSQYSVTGGDWLFYNNETEILDNTIRYGGAHSINNASNQDFASKSRMIISSAKTNPWDAGWNIRNKIAIQQGDVVLLTFYIRAVGSKGKVNFFAENASNFNKEVILTMPIDTSWKLYYIPVEMRAGYNIESLVVGFHLGFEAQTIEIGGFTAINYGKSISKSALPEQINNQFYDGWETNAPWRSVANKNIDSLRKANLTIQTRDDSGNPVANAWVEVNMLRHEFAFGSAVTADKIAGNNNQNNIYQNKIIDLDGKGHGFNWVVFENDMKWPAWEQNWFVSNAELVNAVSWLKDNGIKIRGHTLIWPGFDNMPPDIENNQNDINYIKTRINDHITEILTYPGLAGQIEEWDVLNETVTNRSLENLFRGKAGYPTGREIFTEIFQKAHEIDSTIGLYLNDYITISQQQEAGSVQYENLKSNTQELLDANSGITGLGFQCHIGGFPNGIPSVLGTLDDFYNRYGLTTKITEFDMPTFVSESTGASYLKDFLTATFSHPSVDGFLFWNFWDGSTWLNEGTNLFNRDWSMTQPGSTFVDLVFNEWWTSEGLTSDAQGNGTIRGFKGLYEISYYCGGSIVRDTLELTEDFTYTINCNQLATKLERDQQNRIKIYPNPNSGRVNIELPRKQEVDLKVFALDGSLLHQYSGTFDNYSFDLQDYTPGFYFIELKGKELDIREKLILH